MALMALDIGGSAVKYGLWENNELKKIGQFPTPSSRSDFFQQICQLKDQWQSASTKIDGIAVSCPGEVHEDTGMITDLSFVPFLHFFPFLQPMEKAVGVPVSLFNDADSAALAEMTYGIGQHKENPIFLIIGSGVGFSVVEHGEILTSNSDKVDSPRKFLVEKFRNINNINISPVKMAQKVSLSKLASPNTYTGQDVFKMASQQDPVAQRELAKMYASLSEVIVAIQRTYQPEFIGIGGGISNNPDFFPELKKCLDALLADSTLFTERFAHFFVPENHLTKQDLPILKLCYYKSEANLIGALIHYYQKYDFPLPQMMNIKK